MKTIQTVTIIAAGTQGSMLAFRALAFGKSVSLYSRSEETRQLALVKIQRWLEDWLRAGRLQSVDVQRALERLTLHAALNQSLREAELIIENVPEILELKQSIWRDIDLAAPPQALLCSNSSSLKSSDIGLLVGRKDKTFALNFMTPTKDNLVEVMWNAHTSERTKMQALDFLRDLQHVPVMTRKEIKGFSLNRVWRVIKKECLKLWAEAYTTPEDLDRAWMLEWGTPYGPFGLMDKVGLDIVQQIELSYYAESQNPDDNGAKR